MTKIYKHILRFVEWLVLTVMLLGITLYLLLQVPVVQNELASFIVSQVEKRSNHRIELENVSINWFDEASLRGIKLYDFNDNLLFASELLTVDFEVTRLIDGNQIGFQEIIIEEADLFLKKYNDSTSINITAFIKSLVPPNPNPKNKTDVKITIAGVTLVDFNFKLDDYRKDRMAPDKLDYNHLNLAIPEINLTDFILEGDSIHTRIGDFSAQDSISGFTIEQLTSDFTLDQDEISFTELTLKTPHSIIRDRIRLLYDDPSNLSYIIDSVSFDISLKQAEISPKDLSFFADLGSFDEYMEIDAEVTGSIPRLALQPFKISIGQGSYFSGNASLYGLPIIENTFIDLSLSQSKVYEEDILHYTNISAISTGTISFNGNLQGFISDFVADGRFTSKHGVIESDINLKNLNKPENVVYKGNLSLLDFDIGGLLNNQNVGSVNFEGTINGSGLTEKSANFYLAAQLSNSEFIGNNFSSITAKGRFASQFFSGDFAVKDSVLDVAGSADIDFYSEEEIIRFDTRINTADLHKLGLTDSAISVSAFIYADVRNFDINTARGSIEIDSLVVEEGEVATRFDKVRLVAINLNKDNKLYELQASGLNAKLKGDFNITDLIKELPVTLKEYQDYFTQDKIEIDRYYAGLKSDTIREFKAKLQVAALDVNPYLELFNMPVTISRDSYFEASFRNRSNSNFSFYADVDSLFWNEQLFTENEVDINASKDNDSTGVLAVILLNSREQNWDGVSPTKAFVSEAVWNNNTIDMNLSVEQPESQTDADINASIKFLRDTVQFKFDRSELMIFQNNWKVSNANTINFTEKKILIEDLEFHQNEQSIKVNGVYADSTATRLKIDIDNFLLKNLSILLPKEILGELNTSTLITRVDYGDPLRFETDVDIQQLKFEDYLVGDLKGSSDWDTDIDGLIVDLKVNRDDIRTIAVDGVFVPSNRRNQLDVDTKFDQASLKLLQPVFSNLVSNLDGEASGSFKIKGMLDAPTVTGNVDVSNGQMRFVYLNTFYNFSGPVVFSKNQIKLNEILLLDRFNDRAILSGDINHKSFSDFSLDLNMNYRDFELLNTNKSNNSLYYGTAYATGDLSIKGAVDDIYIDASASTRPNTKIFVPVSDYSEVNQSTFINFVNFEKEPKDTTETSDEVDLTGITMNFDIDVTSDAYIELIFDPRTGDIIRGSGDGNLQMSINSSGDFELFGGIEISDGAYNFTTSFINKEFQIKKGGTINWYGDPYEGILDIEAQYRQIADLEDYDSELLDAAKQPVFVILSLEGSMLNPSIDFRLELSEDVNNQTWQRTIASINAESNSEELKRQVFSLLILRKFSNRQSFTVSSSSGLNTVGSSVSEFLSNQLSYWLNQVDENLEVSIDLASLDNEAFNTFQLRLGYSFFDGRLRVTRWGAVTEEESATANSIVGNWQVEYLLTEDGRLRVKVFRRAQQIQTQNQTTGEQETGISLQFVRSFDQLKDLLTKEREKAIRRREAENETESESS